MTHNNNGFNAMLTTRTEPPVIVRTIEVWPNNLGFDCTVNRTKFSVMRDRKIGRVAASRLYKDGDSMYCEVCPQGIEFTPCDRELAAMIFRHFRDRLELWEHCGN